MAAILTLAAGVASAQGPAEEPGPTIRSVVFEGRVWIPEEALVAATGLQPGTRLETGEEMEAFQRLLRFPWIATVQGPTLETLQDGSVNITFRIREKPLIADVRVEGAGSLDAADARSLVELHTGSPLDREALEGAESAMAEKLHRDGFLGASVRATTREVGAGRVDVIVTVKEGPRVHVREVTIEGTSGIPASEALEAFGLRPRRLLGLLSRGTYVPEDIEGHLASLRDYYISRGYLSAQVGLAGLDIEPEKDSAAVRLVVREGPRYRLAGVRVRGSKIFTESELEEAVGIPTGVPYSREEIGRGFDRLIRRYEQRSDRLPRMEIQHEYGEESEVTVVFEIREEQFLETGTVRVEGNRRTKDRVVRRHVTLVPAQPFASTELARTKEKLESTGIFEKVSVEVEERPSSERDDTTVADVKVKVEEKSHPGSIEASGNLDSDTGIAGEVNVRRLNFDILRLPQSLDDDGALMGAGQYLDIRLALGSLESQYFLRFEDPAFLRTDLALSVGGGVELFDRDTYQEERAGGSIELRKFFDDERRVSAALAYMGQLVTIDRVDSDAPRKVVESQGQSFVGFPRLELRYEDLEQDFFVGSMGLSASAKVDLADQYVGSQEDFVRISATADYRLPLLDESPGRQHILHLGLRVGWMDALGGSTTPFYEQFYLGGVRDFRGFEYRRLGPHEDSTPVGGEGSLWGTVEYSMPLYWRELRGVLLLDWGDLEPTFSAISPSRFRLSVGGGLAIRLPFLPANLYWVQAVLREDEDEPQLFGFTVGLKF